jgi:hypothetical protein
MNPSSISDQSTKGKKRIPVDSDIDSSAVTTIRTNNNTQATAAHTAPSYPIYYEAKESLISQQVSQNRRQEIYEYLKLFGYKPDNTILQIYNRLFQQKEIFSKRSGET